ncbi:MAG: hypothetical protein EBR41_01370 [Crocinitomicaceae bacterium]|nr:hypothetical protein [Crocinitomicaceae bacterium]NCX04159.1 hypothetical protein [Actinomycetota bacterium]
MANIFARSPYLIRIAETGQNGSKIELFLANGSFLGSPQYTLSKLIPASNNVETLYDISPYIREYIRFTSCSAGGNSAVTNPTNERVNVRVKRYKLVGLTYNLLNTIDYIAFDGYSYYEQGFNFDNLDYGLDAGNYYYNPTSDAGKIRVTTGASFTARYTNLSTAVVTSLAVASSTFDIPRVRTANVNEGNKVEILNGASAVQATWYFYPLEECKYTPVIIDFVNKYGAWQREFFFKASNDNFSVENTEYNLMQTNSFNYNVKEGQRKVFNANGKKSVKVNTGWVKETWKEVLKQIMLSERILIDDKPAKINTKSTELFKSINTKQINYTLEFEFAYDVINSVI